MTVHGCLVTVPGPADEGHHLSLWFNTWGISNWLDAREGKSGITWHVMVPDEHMENFLVSARALCERGCSLTVEEIEGAGDGETYKLLAGNPHCGWEKLPLTVHLELCDGTLQVHSHGTDNEHEVRVRIEDRLTGGSVDLSAVQWYDLVHECRVSSPDD